jgi:putative inorganic carbon (hco3(-)) transporter
LGGRDTLWQASLAMIANNPWTGAGIGNGPTKLQPYIDALTTDYENAQEHGHPLPSHNPILEAGVDTGVFGMLLYTSFILTALRRFFKYRGRSELSREPMAAYAPMVLSVSLGFLFSYVKAGGIENNPVFFLILAYLIIPADLTSEVSVQAQANNNSSFET